MVVCVDETGRIDHTRACRDLYLIPLAGANDRITFEHANGIVDGRVTRTIDQRRTNDRNQRRDLLIEPSGMFGSWKVECDGDQQDNNRNDGSASHFEFMVSCW